MAARILVIDDNVINLKLISKVLEDEGYQVEQAIDAEIAEEMIKLAIPDLILMDIALPGMDGLTLTRLLKSREETMHIPIVALTAFAMKGDDQKAYEAGCKGYLSKPVDISRLPSQIEEFLNSGK
jgi:CheY-like chemotaxis protein